MRLETCSNKLELPLHDACLISRVNCKKIFPEIVSFVDAEKTFVNIFKFTHSCVTCFAAIICMRAGTCFHLPPWFMIPLPLTRFSCFPAQTGIENLSLPVENFPISLSWETDFPERKLIAASTAFLMKIFRVSKTHKMNNVSEGFAQAKIHIKSDSGIIASAAVSVSSKNLLQW